MKGWGSWNLIEKLKIEEIEGGSLPEKEKLE